MKIGKTLKKISFQTDNQHASYAGEKRRERKIVDASSGLLFLKDHFL